MERAEGHFQQTNWDVVSMGGALESPGFHAALDRLCNDYRAPLLKFANYWLRTRQDAEDLVQSYFCHFIRKNLPGAARPERGRFRSFLITTFKNHVFDVLRKEGHLRNRMVSIDEDPQNDEAALVTGLEPKPEHKFDLIWAEEIFKIAFRKVRDQYHASPGQRRYFEKLSPLLRCEDPGPYAQIAAALGVNEASVKVAAHRLRAAFAHQFREEVRATAPKEDADEELDYILSLLFTAHQNINWLSQ